jgi:hypothetical protein
MVSPGDAAPPGGPYRLLATTIARRPRREAMYVAVVHKINNPEVAFARGERLIKNDGAPTGVRGLQFYPSRTGAWVTCLWEAKSTDDVQRYVDETLGDSSENTCYEVDAEHAFSRQPLGIAETATVGV